MKTLLYLDYRLFVNTIKLTLRSPKRIIPIIFFLGWIALISIPNFVSPNQKPSSGINLGALIMPQQLWSTIFIFLSFISLFSIYKSFENSSLVFSLSEIDMIIPSPIDRIHVMALKLIKVYAKNSLAILFITLMLYPSMKIFGLTQSGLHPISIFLSLTLFYTIMTNICILINMISAQQRIKKVPAITLLKIFITIISIFTFIIIITQYKTNSDLWLSITTTFTHPVYMILFAPAKWITNLLLSPINIWMAKYMWDLLIVLLIAIASYTMILSRDENPYEPSLDISMRFAAMRQALKSGNLQKARAEISRRKLQAKNNRYIPIFGKGASVIVWKNLNLAARQSMRGWIITVIGIIFIIWLNKNSLSMATKNTNIVLYILIGISYILFLGSSIMSHSLRSDMQQSNILKTIPIPTWKIIAIEPIHGTVIISAFCVIILEAVKLFSGGNINNMINSIILCIPATAFACLSMQMAAVILYPNWEDASQRYLSQMLSSISAIFGMILPIGLFFALLSMKAPLLFTVISNTFVCLVISAIGIGLGTWAYKRHDPTDE